MKKGAGRKWDVCATTLSTICVVQCLGLPLLTIVIPVLAQLGDSHDLHLAIVALAVPITLYVVWSEMMARGNEYFVGCALLGLSLMIMAVTVPFLHDYETAMTFVGGTLLAGAHLWRAFQHQVIEEDV